jgi:AcrR family transcriptional regulator
MAGRYHSPRREDAAAATRAAILHHARELFLERGYAGATVPEIAQAARVAPQTVYASTGGKAAMFAELLKPAINDPVAAEAMTAALQTDDPGRVMALCAAGARRGQERYWDLVYGLMRRPPEDALARQAISNVAAKCLEALTGIARHLEGLGALKPGISLAQAVDTLWFYFGQNAWCSLVGEREWTFDRAEEWLREAASRDLLPEAGPIPGQRRSFPAG